MFLYSLPQGDVAFNVILPEARLLMLLLIEQNFAEFTSCANLFFIYSYDKLVQ